MPKNIPKTILNSVNVGTSTSFLNDSDPFPLEPTKKEEKKLPNTVTLPQKFHEITSNQLSLPEKDYKIMKVKTGDVCTYIVDDFRSQDIVKHDFSLDKLYSHQRAAVLYMLWSHCLSYKLSYGGKFLLDDTGLGKTLTMIFFFTFA